MLAVIESHLRGGLLDMTAAVLAVQDLRVWPAQRWPLTPLISRCFALRDNVRAYDAFYVALAESLEAPLLARDARLAAAPRIDCEIRRLA